MQLHVHSRLDEANLEPDCLDLGSLLDHQQLRPASENTLNRGTACSVAVAKIGLEEWLPPESSAAQRSARIPHRQQIRESLVDC